MSQSLMHSLWPRWRSALIVVKPATVVAWHRRGFRLYWRWKSRKRGRPKIDAEVRSLIRRMAGRTRESSPMGFQGGTVDRNSGSRPKLPSSKTLLINQVRVDVVPLGDLGQRQLAGQLLQRDLGLELRRKLPSLPHGSVSHLLTVGATLASCPRTAVHLNRRCRCPGHMRPPTRQHRGLAETDLRLKDNCHTHRRSCLRRCRSGC